jgi:hypothetical protein
MHSRRNHEPVTMAHAEVKHLMAGANTPKATESRLERFVNIQSNRSSKNMGFSMSVPKQ